MDKLRKNPHMRIAISIIALLLPFALAALTLSLGNLKFWYDPARDMLSAWNNFSNPTLIGPTSGIPGIFYGPYWIWLLSFGLLFSKDPLVVTFITATLPYIIIFPLIWFQFRKYFGLTALISGWLLFMLGIGMEYATQLWNPYPAPLMTLALIYLLINVSFQKLTRSSVLVLLLSGFILGLIINFHISFGIGLLCGTIFFFVWQSFVTITQHKQNIGKLLVTKLLFFLTLGGGIVAAFLPTLLFEIRHGFNQIQTVIQALTKYGAVVQTVGLSKETVLSLFVERLGLLLHIPVLTAGILALGVIIFLCVLSKQKKLTLRESDHKILTVTLSLLSGVFFIYITARNPIWAYHFIGVEILYLILITFVIAKIKFLRDVLLVWTSVVIVVSITAAMNMSPSYFRLQQQAVKTIQEDAKSADYTAFAYSASIYSYEYSYLFRWLAHKDIPYDPGMNKSSAAIVYLIIPSKGGPAVKDFINNRSSEKAYKTEKVWNLSDEIVIAKRVKH